MLAMVVEECTWDTYQQESCGAEILLLSLDVGPGCCLETQPSGSWGRRLPCQLLGRILGKNKKMLLIKGLLMENLVIVYMQLNL